MIDLGVAAIGQERTLKAIAQGRPIAPLRSLSVCRELESEVAMRGAICDGLCANQFDAPFTRHAVVRVTRRRLGELGNALVLEVVGKRANEDVERHACLRGDGPMTEWRGEEAPDHHTQ